MKISEMIVKLQEMLEKEGDLRVTVYDEYTANEGWDYKNEELWLDAEPIVGWTADDNDEFVEKVVVM